MFHGDQWAAAFVSVLGVHAPAGLDCLKAMVPPVQAIPGALFGYTAARQLEAMLRESAAQTGFGAAATTGDEAIAAEYAIRFIALLVEKNKFAHADSFMRRIEKRIDEASGILDVTVETAVPLDSALAAELRRQILEKTGAAGVKMDTRLVPELLGGCRIRIGSFYIDASLKGQLEAIAAELQTAAVAGVPFGAAASGGTPPGIGA